ncbi:MAG: hypothetical protein JW934_09130 [Anaerolineae bacterium]|nr:hypothetical protein [Anaerolineae bacterium]
MISVSPRRKPSRWMLPVLLLIALTLGTGIGLLVSWALWPVEYVNVAPSSLYPAHRNEYLVLIAVSYARNRDLGQAQRRLADLGSSAQIEAQLVALAEDYILNGKNASETRALAGLAYALGYRRAALLPYLPEVLPTATWTPFPTVPTSTLRPLPTATETPIPTPTETAVIDPTPIDATAAPSPTPVETPTALPTTTPMHTLRPTWTPTITPTPRPRYKIVEQQRTCDPPGGVLAVTVLDETGRPQPGVELLVRWNGGDDRFFTGLKPELGPGYADFTLARGQTYELVMVGMESDVVQGLDAEGCGEAQLASWTVVLRLNRP